MTDPVKLAMVVHADETGWRIGTMNAWLWVFTNCETTVYLIRSGKGAPGARGGHTDTWRNFRGRSGQRLLQRL